MDALVCIGDHGTCPSTCGGTGAGRWSAGCSRRTCTVACTRPLHRDSHQRTRAGITALPTLLPAPVVWRLAQARGLCRESCPARPVQHGNATVLA